MKSLTVQQLQCFDAVIAEGSYQAAAIRLGRTHPTVFTAIKNLEAQVGVALFDRTTEPPRQRKRAASLASVKCCLAYSSNVCRSLRLYSSSSQS